ncbi:uncharacterized protein LOC106090394 [Stomoxys calcitrans]|uniref:uncharacterized protein LOC106090394 n=1 Tax=Stomoxys calcitrans TaxID=35570 RepID=UPI0027E32462|nr:uncharacterized protein LOC106090394 [Stomoxys calcitrans]
MYKKFVPLNSTKSPTKNPYEVRTFMGEPLQAPRPEWRSENCGSESMCRGLNQNSVIGKVLTLEEEVRKFHHRPQPNAFARRGHSKCKKDDSLLACVVPQRSPEHLKLHARLRENYLKAQSVMSEYSHAHDMNGIYSHHSAAIKLDSPPGGSEDDNEGDGDNVNCHLELASPECSREMFYVPTPRILEIKRPKSGIFVNESQAPDFNASDGTPFSHYNPRVLQEQFDAQNLEKIDVIPGSNKRDLWTWNLGVQRRERELDRRFIEAAVPKFDCDDIELTVYSIPQDLEKTFSARILFGTKALQPEPEPRRQRSFNRPLEMACLYAAFVESFRLNADFWSSETMDNILKMGEKLLAKSHKLNYKSMDNDYDILPQIAERQAEIGLKTHFCGPLKSEPNIYKALTLYFSKYNACVLCSKNLYLLIWKRCRNVFDIFDPNGRGENCERNFERGKCAHISTNFVEHLVHLIVNLSQTDMEGDFKLYQILLVSFGKLLQSVAKKPFAKNVHKIWTVVNESFALIPGCNNGLFQPSSALVPNPSMLISVMAILYSLIERPNVWKPDTIDELIRLGTAYHKSLRRKLKLKDNQHVHITDLPDKYVLGTYKASLKKDPFFYNGTLSEYCQKFSDSLLSCGLSELFHENWEAALIQIDNSVLSVWRDNELFYVYDAFRRGKVGQVLDPDDYMSKGVAVLQMHSSFDSLLRVLCEKALHMRRGGKFFIHAINVGCIKPLMDGKPRKLRYPKLKLTPQAHMGGEATNDEDAEGDREDDTKASKKMEKSKKDKKKMLKVCSIESLKEHERLPAYDNVDVVEGLVDDVVGNIICLFPEPTVARPKLYKSATQVLLRSDKEYLEQLKYMVQHDQDYDNVNASFPTEKPEDELPTVTLEQELTIASNFNGLSDGAWVIFGSTALPRRVEEQTKVRGLISAVVAVALTSRYNISTWNSALIDYALNATETFGNDFQVYQYTLGMVLSGKIPSLSLGRRNYRFKVQKVFKSDLEKTLRQALLENLVEYNRLLVICQRFSCTIVKRYNFLYMFVGYPVNSVGYRHCKGKGPACLLRFAELDTLIRRIEYGCNPQGCDVTNYVVMPLKVYDITSDNFSRYRQWPAKMEQRMYEEALHERKRLDESKKSKLEFLESELQKETERLEDFRNSKTSRRSKKTNLQAYHVETVESDAKTADVSEQQDHESSQTVIPEGYVRNSSKHTIAGKSTKASSHECPPPRPLLYGYRLREKDYLYKIQGSKFLQRRAECLLDEVKPCFFASTLAILYAIVRPHNQWTSQRVDQVIDSALILSDHIENASASFEKIIKHVSVDDYTFDIWIKTFEPKGLVGNLAQNLERATKLRKQMLLHTANCTYAVYKDDYYHLFDPYPSMEILDNIPGGGASKPHRDVVLKEIRRYGERNTASWILFADAESMVHYMDQRCCSATWKEEGDYSYMVVDVISYKKSPLTANVLQLLTGSEGVCNVPGEEETGICAHNETIAWLEHCLPIWSRLNKRNSAGIYRGMMASKFKNYDIEIENRLWSLWANLHPQAAVFDESSRGKQYLACCVVSLCAVRLFRLVDWSAQLLDSIVINGDAYHRQSVQDIATTDYEIMAEDLDTEYMLDNVRFSIHLEPVCYGKLYGRPHFNRLNLAQALMYFFGNHRFGLLQCSRKCLAFGYIPAHDGGYFMFDCQGRDRPLFPSGQGAAYVLRTKYLEILLYCMVVTLNIPFYNVEFTLHTVETFADNESVAEDTVGN